MGNKVPILDEERITRKLQRMAFQIWEHNSSEHEIVLIGIEGSGQAVAENLGDRLRSICPIKITVLSLKINKKQPLDAAKLPAEDLNGRSLVLVDDVANSGKTLLYSLKSLLDFEPKKIMIAVLVDRKHKSFPVSPDIVGHEVATTLQEQIIVECEGNHITAAYLQ
jgi:pyrimidine operon attenuation protein/uracil phosphoribosyltransferase